MTDIQKLAPITHTGTQTIVTSRLVLRPFQMADAGDTFVWASNPRVVRFLSYTPHADLSETKSVLQDWVSSYQSPAVYNWAIVYDIWSLGTLPLFHRMMPAMPVISAGRSMNRIGTKAL